MKVLVVGSGGREHAICWKLSQSVHVDKIFCAPGNGGTASDIIENVDIAVMDFDKLTRFALGEKIDLVIQKAVELGVSRLVPLNTKRADVRRSAYAEMRPRSTSLTCLSRSTSIPASSTT